MASLIEDLQRDALNWDIPVTQLLQKSLVVATKLNVKELADWVKLELDGYPTADTLPNYRHLSGMPQVWNPYHGYQGINFAQAEVQEMVSTMHFGHPLSQIEHDLQQSEKSGDSGLHYGYPPQQEILLRGMIRGPKLQPSIYLNASQLKAILEAVRRRVLQWALDLESAGIRGNGVSFTVEEKEKAQSTYNVTRYESFLPNK
ncbi:MAG: hypothetical protein ACR2IF_00845 [Terriglobales bacterium]